MTQQKASTLSQKGREAQRREGQLQEEEEEGQESPLAKLGSAWRKAFSLPASTRIITVPVDHLVASRYQPRDPLYEDEDELKALAQSIQNAGRMHPLPQVRPHPDKQGYYEIITGHRRINAVSKYLGWKEVQCEVFERASELSVLYWVGMDNLNRKQFAPYEKGQYFSYWKEKFGIGVEDIAEIFGRTPRLIWEYISYYREVERFHDPLGPGGKKELLKHLTKDRLSMLMAFKSEQDRIVAAKKIMDNPEISNAELALFLDASNNAYTKIHGDSPASSASAWSTKSRTSSPSVGREEPRTGRMQQEEEEKERSAERTYSFHEQGKANSLEFHGMEESDFPTAALKAVENVVKAETFEEKHESAIRAKETVSKFVKDYMTLKASIITAQKRNSKTVWGVTRYHMLGKDGRSIVCVMKIKGKKQEDTVQLRLDQLPVAD
jgi:ParB/RepB/Spo0J family partition protein